MQLFTAFSRDQVAILVHPFVHLSICSSIHLFIHPSVHPSICSSIHLFIHPSVYPSICSSIHLFIHPSVYPSICSSIHLFIHPSVHPSICYFIHLLFFSLSLILPSLHASTILFKDHKVYVQDILRQNGSLVFDLIHEQEALFCLAGLLLLLRCVFSASSNHPLLTQLFHNQPATSEHPFHNQPATSEHPSYNHFTTSFLQPPHNILLTTTSQHPSYNHLTTHF